MGIFDGISNRFRVNDEDEDYENEDLDDYEDEEEAPRRGLFGRKRTDEDEEDYEPSRGPINSGARSGGSGAPAGRGSAPVQPRVRSNNVPGPAAPDGQVQYIHPTLFEDAQQIADILRNHHTVLLNLEGLDSNLAQRIVDFSTGSCYALRGHFRSISASDLIIVFTPEDVGIGEAVTISASKASAASSNAFGGAAAQQSRMNPSGMNMNMNGMQQDSANSFVNGASSGAYGRNGAY